MMNQKDVELVSRKLQAGGTPPGLAEMRALKLCSDATELLEPSIRAWANDEPIPEEPVVVLSDGCSSMSVPVLMQYGLDGYMAHRVMAKLMKNVDDGLALLFPEYQ